MLRTRRAFMLRESVAVVLVLATLICFLLTATTNNRRLARLGDDLAKLKTLGVGTAQYTSDNADQFSTFTWRRNQIYQNQYPDLNNAVDDLQAAANQAVYILRTRGQRPDMPRIISWVPHISFNPLVLADHLDQKLPWRGAISSADRDRLNWAADPLCYEQGCFTCPAGPITDPNQKRVPYGSSFQTPTSFYDLSPTGSRLYQSGPHNLYYVPGGAVLGPVQMSFVAFPSQKVLMHDSHARHFGSRQPYCTHDQARLPLLMVDGSVQVRSAADSNRGWNPNSPTSPVPTSMTYQPSSCSEPPSINPGGDQVFGRFRYTRRDLLGRDFGGPEVN